MLKSSTLVVLLAVLALMPSRARGHARSEDGTGVKFQRITVRPGDTLWSISQTYLKDPTRWDEILRYNKLPSSDPTVALPGTPLEVPVELIKEDLRAAKLVYAVRKVLARKKDTADWSPVAMGQQLFRGDGLRTLTSSWARVEFENGALLSLDPDSMAILKPPQQQDHDLRLLRGGIHTTMARVVTPSARIIPKAQGTKYSARLLQDLSTRVQVYKGAADVEGGGRTVEVRGGFFTDVQLNRAPSLPVKIPNMASLGADVSEQQQASGIQEAKVTVRRLNIEGSAPDASVGDIGAELEKLSLGVPVAAYDVQVSRSETFDKILLDKTYDADVSGGLAADIGESNLPKGKYWIRVAIVDLLGTRGSFSQPKPYRVGVADKQNSGFKGLFEIRRPDPLSGKETVRSPRYRISGKADRDLTVTFKGERVSLDEDGNFAIQVLLNEGVNAYRVEAADARGHSITRECQVEYQP